MSAPEPSMSMFASTAEYWRHMAVRREAEIARLTAELAAARAEMERYKADAGRRLALIERVMDE